MFNSELYHFFHNKTHGNLFTHGNWLTHGNRYEINTWEQGEDNNLALEYEIFPVHGSFGYLG